LVSGVTVATDLAVAVIVGVIVSALVFAWQHARHIHVVSEVNKECDEKVYRVNGPLFFGSASNFLELFDVSSDPECVIVDFASSRVADHSAIEAISVLNDRYSREGKRLHIRHLSRDCRELLRRAGVLIEINVLEDPSYKVASDLLA
jgi:SulP family sulfate permease